jgi:hypothetical protein
MIWSINYEIRTGCKFTSPSYRLKILLRIFIFVFAGNYKEAEEIFLQVQNDKIQVFAIPRYILKLFFTSPKSVLWRK